MQFDQLLAVTKEWNATKTGKYQTTGLEDVDSALASLISRVFDNACMIDPRPEERRFASFLARPAAERVYVGKFDGVIEFLKAVRRANSGQGRRPQDRDVNHDALPLINISRSMDIAYLNSDQQIDRRIGEWVEDKQGKPLFGIERTQVTLNYDVTILATEKSTLSLICNALGAQVRLALPTQFTATSRLIRQPIELVCSLHDAKDISFADVSAPINEERIYAAQYPLTVLADVATAWELEAIRATVRTHGGLM